MSETGAIGRESAERGHAVTYGELRALVKPTGTRNDARFTRREELECEAADLRRRWDLLDPRDVGTDAPGPIVKLLRRQGRCLPGPRSSWL